MKRRYIVARPTRGRINVEGYVDAGDVTRARAAAQVRWPGREVFPWELATREQRAQALAKMQEWLKQ